MTKENNKAIIESYVDTWNRGDIEALSQFWGAEMRHYTRTRAQGYAEVKHVVDSFMRAFPDLRFHIDDIVAENDRVVTRMTATATNTGEYMGMPPTGRKINCTVLGIARLSDGKIVEHWGVTDELAMMSQLGVIPEQYLAAMA
jgi:C-1 hydroxylase